MFLLLSKDENEEKGEKPYLFTLKSLEEALDQLDCFLGPESKSSVGVINAVRDKFIDLVEVEQCFTWEQLGFKDLEHFQTITAGLRYSSSHVLVPA